MYILAVNCGSSSIKGKLFPIPDSKQAALKPAASLAVSNISSKGEKVKIKISWTDGKGKEVNEEGEDGASVDCGPLVSKLPFTANPLRSVARSAATDKTHRVGFVEEGGYQICGAPNVSFPQFGSDYSRSLESTEGRTKKASKSLKSIPRA